MSLSSPPTPTINRRVNLGLITEAVSRSYTVENTKKVYDRVKREWTDFCNCITDEDDDFPTFMNAQKVSDFMFYQCFRRRQKVGGRNGGAVLSFNYEDYKAVLAQYCDAYHLWKQNKENVSFPDPGVEGVGSSAIIQYRAGLKKIFETQVSTNQNSLAWDKVWTIQAKNLVKIVESRKMRVKREKYEEKVTKEFAGYHAVERFDEIERVFWDGGFDNIRSSFPYIRYRMLFLYTTSGILRCESLTKAELSDFQGLTVKKETDIDPLYVMVSQIPEGKTNHGQILYGRATRHANVVLCAVGAMSMYLMLRFNITREFLDPEFDWLNNEAWFRIKLLVDPFRGEQGRFDQPMKSGTYGRAVKKVFRGLGLVSSHLVHIGRVMGSKLLEFMEVEGEEIRRLGNWNPSIQEACYSKKLPMIPIRALAGFSTGNGIYHNQRTVVDVPMALQEATPIGKFVFHAIHKVSAANLDGGGHDTAAMFLDFLRNMNIIFLQDMAVLMLKHPERLGKDGTKHPLLVHIDILDSELFTSFVDTMKMALDQESTPLDCRLEAVLPAVHQRLDASHKATTDLSRTTNQIDQRTIQIDNRVMKMEGIMLHFLRGVSDVGRACLRGHDDSMDVDEESYVEAELTTPTRRPSRHAANRDDDGHYPTLTLLPVYSNLLQLYHHWYGLGEFERHGDDWSISKLEEKHGNEWRRSWSSAQKCQFSRASRIIQAMKIEADHKHIDLDRMAIQWSETMEVNGKFTLGRMMTWLTDRGFMDRRKARGKNAPKEHQNNN